MAPHDMGEHYDRGHGPRSRDGGGGFGRALSDYATARLETWRARLKSASEPETGTKRVRDYVIDTKLLGIAIGLEVGVAVTQWYGADLMAKSAGGGNWIQEHQMMLAPTLYALAEVTRVPLGVASRTHKSALLRTAALAAALLSATITIKSTAQNGELMYRPRLHGVRVAEVDLGRARAADRSLEDQIAAAAVDLQSQQARAAAAQASVDDARGKLAQIPAPSCWATAWVDSEGRQRRGRQCASDPRTGTLSQALKAATDAYGSANERLKTAQAAWTHLIATRPAVKAAVAEAESERSKAIMNSQVHSFTATLFRKGPQEVTEQEAYTFLQLFVFFPACVISLLGFVLACAAVERLRPTHIELDRKIAKEIRKRLGT